MRARLAVLAVLLVALWPRVGRADASPALAVVQAVPAGDELLLADGRRVRLAGIAAPLPPLGWTEGKPWRAAVAAQAALRELALGRRVRLGPAATDRYGRALAQVYREDGLWLEAALVDAGEARVWSTPQTRAHVPELLALEAKAREARRGLWRDPFYAVRRPEALARDIETFQLVEGKLVAGDKVKGQIFLNFAADWRHAATLHLARPAVTLFREAGLKPLDFIGKRVRARGWVAWDRRPEIEVTHPEQIELLDPE
jgi:endonuclease YncB( thermonuclease family)